MESLIRPVLGLFHNVLGRSLRAVVKIICVIPNFASQQVVQGLPRGFAADIPQRHINPWVSKTGRVLPPRPNSPVPEFLANQFALPGTAADNKWGHGAQ